MKIEFKATLDGDALKGTMGGGQFTRGEFTRCRRQRKLARLHAQGHLGSLFAVGRELQLANEEH